MSKKKKVIDEKAKDELIALAKAKIAKDPLYEKYQKLRDASIIARSHLVAKYKNERRD